MAYETGVASDLDDLFTKLLTFAVANGWTQDEAIARDMPALHKNNIFVQFRYDGTTPSGNGRSVGIYQSTGFTAVGAIKPSFQADDSGGGFSTAGAAADASLGADRCIFEIGDGPFTYWLFENDASPAYLHVVVRKGSDRYRHFGFGELDKFGDWDTATGGEYCYGHRSAATNYLTGSSTYGLDAGFFDTLYRYCATIRATGLPGQGGTEKWLAFMGNPTQYAAAGNKDRANIQRRLAIGGVRAGPFSKPLGFFRGYPGFSGLIPMASIPAFYIDGVNLRAYMLGYQKDVRYLNIGTFEDAEEVAIGGETWILFPVGRRIDADAADSSRYGGFAYRKVTA